MSDEIAKLLGLRFMERRDVKAWQQEHHGGYFPDYQRLVLDDLRTHISGEVRYGPVLDQEGNPRVDKNGRALRAQRTTLGHYLVSKENTCRVFAFDIDLCKTATVDDGVEIEPRKEFLNPDSQWRPMLVADLTHMAHGLARRVHRTLEMPVAVAYSGSKGVHVYGFLDGGTPSEEARLYATGILDEFGCFTQRGKNFYKHEESYTTLEIEVFPKQENLDGKELGNLLRLPLGVNLKSGHKGRFIRTQSNDPTKFWPMKASDALNGVLPW